jgi:hypothetical protein
MFNRNRQYDTESGQTIDPTSNQSNTVITGRGVEFNFPSMIGSVTLLSNLPGKALLIVQQSEDDIPGDYSDTDFFVVGGDGFEDTQGPVSRALCDFIFQAPWARVKLDITGSGTNWNNAIAAGVIDPDTGVVAVAPGNVLSNVRCAALIESLRSNGDGGSSRLPAQSP